jgi:1-phosphofructokinase
MGNNIITVTLNPSLDRTLVTHHLAIGYHNLTQETTRLDPAGRGLGVSRALSKLGIPTQAIVLLGDDATGKAYQALISEEAFDITVIVVSGRTRSKTIIWDTGKNTETQITEESADISQNDIHNIVSTLHQKVEKNDIVIYAGPLPKGVPDNTYAWLTDVAHEVGASVSVAASGQPLIEALKAHPSLVALNRIEVESIFNYPVRVMKDVVKSAMELHQYGAQEVLIERRNAGKVFFARGEEHWLVNIPTFEQGTSSGIWDAFLAAFLSGRFQRRDLDESLTLGASAAFYTASKVGHKFGTLQQIKECEQGILVSRLEKADMDNEIPNQTVRI